MFYKPNYSKVLENLKMGYVIHGYHHMTQYLTFQNTDNTTLVTHVVKYVLQTN